MQTLAKSCICGRAGVVRENARRGVGATINIEVVARRRNL